MTVTYGNRSHLIEQVIEALKDQSTPVSRIVVVDNGSINTIMNGSYNNNIEIVKLDRNYGSAAGYRAGIERAYQTDCDLIWLLDDDNKPNSDALEKLLAARKCLGDNENDCFASLRLDRRKYLDVAFRNGSVRVIPDSFMRFHIKSILKKVADKYIGIRSNASDNKLISPIKRIEYAIFGGLLFSKNWIDKIGYPDENYFSYMDDVDFTTRIIKRRGNIYLVATSIIEDIDKPWFSKSGEKFPQLIDVKLDNLRVHYTLRNSVYLENKYFVNNKYIYFVNMGIYLIMMFLVGILRNKSILGTVSRLGLLIAAIRDGLNKNMGHIDDISKKGNIR